MTVGVTFYGARGSTPFCADTHTDVGGNTCCVVLDIPNHDPIIFDMGSGLYGYGMSVSQDTYAASVLLTHLHWDHVAGLPFFAPALRSGGRLDIYGPPYAGLSLEATIRSLISPPYFPVTIDVFAGTLNFHDTWNQDFEIGDVKIMARPVPHTNATNGFRVDTGTSVITYIPDHQQPIDDSSIVAESVLELAEGADLLIHDGQYPLDLFEQRAHWGHSTPDFAVEVARQSGCKRLALFSHDPMHNDEKINEIESYAQDLAADIDELEVFAARQSQFLSLQ